jgi:hypothetical protein
MRAMTGLALTFVLASALPALAQTSACGSQPFAPALATPAEMNQKSAAEAATAKHDAFMDVKNWQGDLKTYRACLDAQGSKAKADLAGLDKTKDADKIKTLKDQVAQADTGFNASVDAEEKVVNEFHALQAAYCQRTDVDRASCPK